MWGIRAAELSVRVHNVGISTSLNSNPEPTCFCREEGSYTVQQTTQLDIHVGQSYSFLVTMDQNASSDYYIVASARWNLSAGAARPNPQGSFRYASINVTQQYLLRNEPPVMINGERRATLNGISYSPPETPLRLADQYTVKGVYTLDFPTRPLKGSPKLARSVINGTYR
ncbi:Monocopper oxidase-like protein SKU5, partial [Ananas comosus]